MYTEKAAEFNSHGLASGLQSCNLNQFVCRYMEFLHTTERFMC